MDQPGKVANPARGQLNREKNIPLSPCVPENLVSRDGFSRPVPRQPAHLHTQAESNVMFEQHVQRDGRAEFFFGMKTPGSCHHYPTGPHARQDPHGKGLIASIQKGKQNKS